MTSPKLRFKEFGGCWENTSFQSLFTFKNGINASKEQYGSGTKFINVLDIINNPNGITYDSIIGSVQVFQKDIDKNLVNYGDVVFQRSSETREEVGQSNVYLSKEPVVFGGFVIRGSARVPYDPLFMNGLLKTDKVRDQITQLSGGSTRFNIGQDSLNKVSVFLPSKEEQTKIASFLSAVDEKISQLTQKHELLSQYKQGTMQKLFSQQIRFKADDGSEFGEWEKAKIGAITETIFGYPFDSKEMVEDSSGIPLMRGINIGEHHIRHSFELDRFFLRDISKLEKYFVKVNDIVLSMDGSKVGRNSAFVTEKDAGSLLVQRVCILREKEKTNIQYVYQWIISKEFYRYVDQVKTSSGIPHISGKQIQDYEIGYPCLEEQTKIANFLSTIDQKIEVVAQQIEQAKQWKKGLLQQMFV